MRIDRRMTLPVDGVRLSLWRAAAIFRIVGLGLCLFLIVRWQPIYARADVAVTVGAVMIVWTAAVLWLALRGQAHRATVVLADAALTAGLTLLTIAAQTPAQHLGGMVTLTTLWAAGPAIEAGIVAGPVAGVVIGLAQLIAALVVRQGYDGRTLYSAVLLVVTGGMVGLVAHYVVRAEDELRVAAAARAAVAERERLSRSIHDGVLQVLGLVHRTGRDAGPPWTALAAEAGEQEAALRDLITSRPSDATPVGQRDLGDDLRTLRTLAVTVSTPGESVPMEAVVAGELTAAVRAALQNVAQHAGDGAHAWVLLETLDGAVRVTVRDDGAGMAHDRLIIAAHEGRLGVLDSVQGRVRDLGGHCTIATAPGDGTEIVITVPRR